MAGQATEINEIFKPPAIGLWQIKLLESMKTVDDTAFMAYCGDEPLWMVATSTIALYTELHAECYQRTVLVMVVDVRWSCWNRWRRWTRRRSWHIVVMSCCGPQCWVMAASFSWSPPRLMMRAVHTASTSAIDSATSALSRTPEWTRVASRSAIFILLQQELLLLLLLLLHSFNDLFSRTTWVSQYQKSRTTLVR